MTSRLTRSKLVAALLATSLPLLGACGRNAGDSQSDAPKNPTEAVEITTTGPCGLFEEIGAGLFLEADDRAWADPSDLLTPMLAPWGLDELRAEPANTNVIEDQEWAHHLSATVRGRTQGSLLAMTGTDPLQREAAALLLAVLNERIDRRDRRRPSNLSLTTILLAEPSADAWIDQVAGLLLQRPVSLRRVGAVVALTAGSEGVSTNRESLRPILDELTFQQGIPVVEFPAQALIPGTLNEVGLAVISLALDLEPLEPCRGSDAARLQRNFDLVDGLLDKLDGALGFDLPE